LKFEGRENHETDEPIVGRIEQMGGNGDFSSLPRIQSWQIIWRIIFGIPDPKHVTIPKW